MVYVADLFHQQGYGKKYVHSGGLGIFCNDFALVYACL